MSLSGAIERRWHELAPLFDAAFELDARARIAYLDAIEDPELRDALACLLAQSDQPGLIDAGSEQLTAALIEPDSGSAVIVLAPCAEAALAP